MCVLEIMTRVVSEEKFSDNTHKRVSYKFYYNEKYYWLLCEHKILKQIDDETDKENEYSKWSIKEEKTAADIGDFYIVSSNSKENTFVNAIKYILEINPKIICQIKNLNE